MLMKLLNRKPAPGPQIREVARSQWRGDGVLPGNDANARERKRALSCQARNVGAAP